MNVWVIVVIVILVVLVSIFIVLTFITESENKKKQQANILYPFSGYLAPSNPPWTVNQSKNNVGTGKTPEDGLSLLGLAGNSNTQKSVTVPQIKCPVGYKINIVGAFFDVIDPYGECGNKPDPTLQATCGSSGNRSNAANCGNNIDCGIGMSCVSGKCTPKKCSVNGDCSFSMEGTTVYGCPTPSGRRCSTNDECEDGVICDGGRCSSLDPGAGVCMSCENGYCASMPVCKNVVGGLNRVCSVLWDQNRCRPRDASAYLAKYCDGKTECLGPGDVWKPNEIGGAFGPLPCRISAENQNPLYTNLPIVSGWGGGPANKSESKDNIPANFNQGYYVHGIYTCVPNNENALTN